MDAETLVERIRANYITQFQSFADSLRATDVPGAAEVMLQLSEECTLFERMYCVDFISNPGKTEIKEMMPDSFLSFEPFKVSFGNAILAFDALQWDDVTISHDAEVLPQTVLAAWFERWFDVAEKWRLPDPSLAGAIHSLGVRPGGMDIDFGTADTEALWAMLTVIEKAGATKIRISGSR